MTARDRPRLRIVAVATAVVLWSAGCGSTVQQQGVAADGLAPGAAAQDSPSAGLAAPFEGTGTAAGGPSGAQAGGSGSGATAPAIAAGATASRPGVTDSGAAAPSESSPDGGAAAAAAPAGATPAPGAGGRIPADHPGVDGDIVRVGFLYLGNAGTLASAFGVEGYSQGDEVGEFRALVADVNARSGLGGRRVEIIEHDLRGIDATAIEAACARFTEDDPVYLVFAGIGHNPDLDACLAEAGVGFVTSIVAPSQRLVDELRYIYAPDDISLERYAALLGRSLIDHGFFDADAKAGLLHSDNIDDERAVETVLVPTLQAAGVDIVHVEVYSSTDAGDVVGGAPGRGLRLRAAGVTHVVHFATPLYDMIAAESQGWRPAWAVTSRAGPGAFLEGAAPREQLPRAAGPGWQPMSDLNAQQIPGPVSAEEERCDAVLRAAGYQLMGTPRVVAMMMCGSLNYSQQALMRDTEMTAEGFRVGAESLGTQLLSPVTHRLDFAGGRHDGAAAYRYIAWDEACGCFGYTTDQQPTP